MKGLYKKTTENEVAYAANAVHSPNYTLKVSDYVDFEGEIQDGWFWFNARESAIDFFGIVEENMDTSTPMLPTRPISHPWHDITCSMQIIMTYEQNLNMLSQFPEFGLYVKQNNINTIIENGFIYSYVNYILEEHNLLLISFGAVIKIK